MMRILVLAPHTDDGELGCGGTIARLIEEGAIVKYIAFSTCEESVPTMFPKNILEKEVKAATNKLGIKTNNLIIKKFPVRRFNSFRQEILEDLIAIKNNFLPEIIFMPSSSSIHQDHKTIYEEGVRAFKTQTCYGYELPWDNIKFNSTTYFILEQRHISKKIEAVKMYVSQFSRNYIKEDFLMGLAIIRGTQVNTSFAESFESIRVINQLKKC